jgi:hypothetical protein
MDRRTGWVRIWLLHDVRGVLMTEPVWSVGVLLAVGLLGVMVLLAWVGTQD